jgi:hypothetical protein
MVQRIPSGRLWSTALGAAAILAVASPGNTASSDYCVTCQGPDETYRCRVTGSGAKAHDALKLYCVIRTAKEGNHASCKAQKATAGCVGLVKVYTYDGPALDALMGDPHVRELKQRLQKDQRDFAEPQGDGPSSLFELGGRAMNASRRGLKNAGSAIGLGSSDEQPTSAPAAAQSRPAPTPAEPRESQSFVRRSYDCVLSFFRDCGGD